MECEIENSVTKRHDEEISPELSNQIVQSSTVVKLAEGCLSQHLPHLNRAKAEIEQLNENQRVLIETTQQENNKFGDCQLLTDTTDMMEKAKLYHEKLTKIKKEMLMLHDKSAKLKKRALKLQQEKQKEVLQREHQRERESERERRLMAQPANSKPAQIENVVQNTIETDTKES